MRSTLTYLAAAAAAVSLATTTASAQDTTPAAAKATPTYTEPPELTQVTGHLVNPDGSGAKAGVAYFIFQGRLNEIPRANPMEKVKAIAEKTVAVDEGGTFSLTMAPGNYAMVYDPTADPANAGGPGAESMAITKKMSREQIEQRIATLKDNAQNGLPVVDGKIGEAYVIENRFVRPPQIDFGDIQLQAESVILIHANDGAGQAIDMPVALRLRGKNGDIMEPHTPSVSEKGQYSFYDVLPQSYQVFALGTRPKPGMGDEITTPTIKDSQLVFDGTRVEHTVIVEPAKPGDAADNAPPPSAGKAQPAAGEQEIKRR